MALHDRIGSYLQKVTTSLAMGAECMYQYGPGGEQAVPSFAGKACGLMWRLTRDLVDCNLQLVWDCCGT